MRELVFDIGMNSGDDTAYYLASGYEVVAVEANPQLCASALERFSSEIANGQLTIKNVGIASQVGHLTFWVSERSVWSSFDRRMATRRGFSAYPLVVHTIAFSDLLNQYPPALYAKIDIEGSDSEAIRDLARCEQLPLYLSFEGHPDAGTDVEQLARFGYRAFKLVRQNDWRTTTVDNMRWHNAKRELRAFAQRHPPLSRGLSLVRPRVPEVDGWSFAPGSSGPLARDLPGRWMTAAETLAVIAYRRTLDAKFEAGGPGEEWWDVHAMRLAEQGSELPSPRM